ncbi:hypothetical protein ES703_25019 [subsurface metagenome]
MSNLEKRLSNPFSSGGGGVNFETRVQASFVVRMVTGGFVACFPDCPIKKIKLQGKYAGYDTDDLIVFVERPSDGQERKLLGQIKHSTKITEGDNVFGEVIQEAWSDFNNSKLFIRGRDSIALITGPLSTTDTSDVRTILDWARSCENSEEFFTNVEMRNFSSQAKRNKLKAFRSHLKRANNGNDVSDEDLFQFLKHFHLLGYDLDLQTGVTLSLLQSLIGQYSQNNAQNLWSRLVDEVQSANQSAGTITINSLPDDIKEAFKKPVYETIPVDFTRALMPSTKPDWGSHEYASELAIANFLGSWNENFDADIICVSKIVKKDYATWISKIREIIQQPESPIALKNGTWTIKERKELLQTLGSRLYDDNLDIFKQCAITVLTERDPRFDLPPEDRYAASIHGKVLKHSYHLRKGLAESLALIGSNPEALSNCSTGKPATIVTLTIREIFGNSDWVLWGSLDNLLSLLAEADPNEFLNAVEAALQQTPCPFDELFAQEGHGITGANYLTGLLWALETLAWDEQYLVRVSVILGELASHDPGGNWANRPSNSLTTIFLPWFPQTTATIDKRKVAFQTLQKEVPEIAWGLLLSLLPSQHQVSSGSAKPSWRKIIPDDWPENVPQEEYLDQVSFYADIAFEIAKHDLDKLGELINRLDNLPSATFEKVIEYLSSEDIINKQEDERIGLWTRLTNFIFNHKRFADAKWALSAELIAKVEGIAKALAPQNKQNLYRRLFTDRDIDLFEEKGNWQEQQKELEKHRQHAIKEIIDAYGENVIISFADSAESPWKVGFSLGFIADSKIDPVILPNLLEEKNENLSQLSSGFVCGRYNSQGWAWVDKVDMSGWSSSRIGQLLAYLPFNEETWKRSKKLLGKFEEAYWSKAIVNPYQVDSEIYIAVDKLIEYGRPSTSINCLYKVLHEKQQLDKKRAVQALLSAASSKEPSSVMDIYYITGIIKNLQDDPDTNPGDLLGVEWVYLPLLDGHHGASPKLLENRLATDPDFFCKVIRLVYRSKKKPKQEKAPTEKEKNIATNAYRLLREWHTPPGMQADGGFSKENFTQWLESVKAICIESGHVEVALTHVGNVLIHCPPDPDGLWINRAAAEALNARDAEKMRNGFSLAIFNSRGVHTVDPSGKPELELSEKYKKQAEDVENAGYQRLASTLRELAESYTNEARRIVDEHKHEGNDS